MQAIERQSDSDRIIKQHRYIRWSSVPRNELLTYSKDGFQGEEGSVKGNFSKEMKYFKAE